MRTKISTVLVVAEHLIFGGTEKYTLNLVRSLVDRGISVVLVTGGGALLSHVDPRVKVYVTPIGRKGLIQRRAEKKVRDIALRYSVEVIHTQCRTALECSVFAGKSLGIPVVSHEHHMYEPESYPYVIYELENYADKVLTVGPYTRRALLEHGLSKDKPVALRPGEDIREFPLPTVRERKAARKSLGLKEHDPVVLTISRVVMGKGIDKLIRGFAEVVSVVPRAKLLIVGDDEEGGTIPQLKKLIKTLGLEKNVSLLPGTFDLRRYHVAADVFCYPALAKGMSVMEAMAMGLPVVGKKTVRRPLMVEHGISGLMTESTREYKIDPKQIAESLIYLLRRPTKARRMGRAARKRIEEYFTIDQHVKKVLSVYRQAVRDKAPALPVELAPSYSVRYAAARR